MNRLDRFIKKHMIIYSGVLGGIVAFLDGWRYPKMAQMFHWGPVADLIVLPWEILLQWLDSHD